MEIRPKKLVLHNQFGYEESLFKLPYSIQFSSYVNDNPKQSLKAELYFPDASISPFTLIKLDPFKDKNKKMSRWLIGEIELSDDPSWKKKQQ